MAEQSLDTYRVVHNPYMMQLKRETDIVEMRYQSMDIARYTFSLNKARECPHSMHGVQRTECPAPNVSSTQYLLLFPLSPKKTSSCNFKSRDLALYCDMN